VIPTTLREGHTFIAGLSYLTIRQATAIRVLAVYSLLM
jgi:hypothetical protein